MTFQRRVVRHTDDEISPSTANPVVYPGATNEVVDSTTVMSPSGGELGRRLIVLVFGIIQVLILLRIVLLLLDAREGNDLVRFILDASQVFVAPFFGIFNVDALKSGGSVLDVAALAAVVGWTVLEAVALWIVNLFRRETVA
ncbi:MAG: YggT family protein [Chloroflexi bacterium]|nr:YggT family protein [Chloroflexota bacterium]